MMITQNDIDQLPTTKNEAYKYTNIQKLFSESIAIAGAPTEELEDDHFINHASNLVFLNGQLKHHRADGIKIGDLKNCSATTLKKLCPKLDEPLYKLNQKYTHSAYLIEVDSDLKQPLILQHFFAAIKGNLVASHIVIWVKSGSLHLLELDHSLEEDSFIQSCLTNVIVEENAQCYHTKVNTLKDEQHSLSNNITKVFAGGLYEHTLINAGGGTSRHNYHVTLEGELAHADIYGLYATTKQQHVDNQIFIDHKAPHTTSDQTFKGTLDGNSRGIFTSLVRVEKHAQQIAAKQLNKNLILSDKAQAHSRPQLEIYADDVKCSHGSTTGQLSPDELFYFAARGIKPEIARRMLIAGMSRDIIMKIKNKLIKNMVQDLIEGHGSK